MTHEEPFSLLKYFSKIGAFNAEKRYKDLIGQFFLFNKDSLEREKLVFIQIQKSQINKYSIVFISEKGKHFPIFDFCTLNKIHFNFKELEYEM